MASNTFNTPASTQAISTARIGWNLTLDSLLENFYSPANPTTTNITKNGVPATVVPDGMFYRSSTTGTLYIKDSNFHKSNPYYSGQFTRNGIGYIVESSIAALSANAYLREAGELLVTVTPNTRLYIKESSGSNDFVDVGVPAPDSITATMLKSGSVTETKVGPNVATLTTSKVFLTRQVFDTNGQIDRFNAAIEARSESGNVIFGLNANANSSVGIKHVRGGVGIQVVEEDGNTLSRIDANEYYQNGTSFTPVPTGTVAYTIESGAVAGWLHLNGNTIGSSGSSADEQNNNYETLFTSLWNNLANTEAGVPGGRGASAAADWAANKSITLPDGRSRGIIGAGQGTGLTNRTVGTSDGEETHILTPAETAVRSHTHSVSASGTASGGNHTHTVGASFNVGGSGTQVSRVDESSIQIFQTTSGTGAHSHSVSVSGTASAPSEVSGSAHNNMQPWLALYAIIKW